MSQEHEAAATDTRPLVFLSYARADRPRAAALAAALQAAGLDVWWDAEIMGGEAFAQRIEGALDRADAVVVAWSQTSVASDWVRDEAGHGRDRQRLVPVSLDSTPPPLGFKQYHAIDLSRWQGAPHASEVAAVVAAVRARTGEAVATPTLAPPAPAWSRRTLVIAAAGAAGLAGVGMGAWRLLAPPVDHGSVAVLPFKNETGDPQDGYFSDGLSDEVRTALARDNRLRVMGRVSSAALQAESMKAVAGKLGVAFVLSGGVQRAGNQVRISAELTDHSGYSAWAQSFDRAVTDIFAIQSEIAAVVLAALTQRVDAGGKPKPQAPPDDKSYGGTTDVDAYQAYLRGRDLYRRDDGEASDRAALAQFGAAVAADPAFAVARAARARSLAAIASSYRATAAQLRALYDEAIAEATKAAADAPESAYIQSSLGQVLLEGRLDVRTARAPFEKAYGLGNNDASALTLVAHFAAQTGRTDEALSAIARAREIDPLSPLVHRMAGLIRIAGRQFDQALPPLQQSLSLAPKQSVAQGAIALVRLQQGRLNEARAAWQAEPNDALRLSGLAIVERRLGNGSAAQAALDALVRGQGDSALYQQAEVKAQWGDAGGAMALLQRARTVGDDGLLDMKTDALLDPLRPDPRFAALLADIGFGSA